MRLMLLFSFGMTLKTWARQGLIERENRYYACFKKYDIRISFLTYGETDLDFQSMVSSAQILSKKHFNHILLYALFAPFVHWKAFRKTNIFKSNQSQGALVGFLGKVVSPGSKFVVRCGWVRTREMMVKEQQLSGWRLRKAILSEWLGFRLADAIVVVTPSDRDYVLTNYKVDERKVTVIPNAVDEQLFSYADQQVPIREKLKIVLIGRLVEMKNFQGVLKAIAKINHPCEVTIIGEGPYKDRLIEIQAQYNLNVKFLGNIKNDEIPAILRKNNAFVMPQFYASGMPKAILEAMSTGLITLSSNIRAHRELISHNENGLLCESDVDSIVEALQTMIGMPDFQACSMRKSARENIEEKYSMVFCAKQENELYQVLFTSK